MVTLQQLAKALDGEISGDGVLCPGPGHSADDRSLSIKLDDKDPDGFVVNSFSPADKWEDCRDHVREKLGLPKWEPKKKVKKSSGTARPFSPTTARYVYRQADGTPYLQVCRKANKSFFQNHWNGQLWVPGKPEGDPIPYRLPEVKAATLTTPVHICEGEKDADALAALGFVATTNAGGAGNWSDELNRYFRDRHVYIHEDNDAPGRKRAQHIAAVLDPIAASVRVIRLPGLPPKGDVSDWLEGDPSGARLVKHCERTPVWQPPTADADKAVDGGDEHDDATLDEGPRKQADVLIKLAGAATLFHTPDGTGYAKINVDGHNENWPLRSKGFKRWLSRAFYNEAQGAPNSEAMTAALGVLEARAQFDAPESEAYIRVAGHDGCIYIDLADKDWRAIEIDADGWRIIDDPPVRFRRSAGMLPLPEPVAGGSLEKDLRPLLNVKSDTDFVLVVAWLLAALRDRGPYPVLALAGEQGSAKSTCVGILRALVDPNSVSLRTLPRNERDIFIAARNGWLLAFDNVSGLPDWVSDTLCRLATGGGFSTRQLFTDDDEALFASTRPAVINGIEDVITRPDLADRTIFLALTPIPEDARKLEADLWRQFENKRRRIFGALLTAISHGLRTLPDVALDRMPRMADFAVWATACEGALFSKGAFMTAYTGNIATGVEAVLEADQLAQALRQYLTEVKDRFEGTAAQLLQALNGVISETEQRARGWPKLPHVLSNALRRIAPPLRKAGINVVFEPRAKQSLKITITTQPDKLCKGASLASPASPCSNINDLEVTLDDERASPSASPSVTKADGKGNGDTGDAPPIASVTRNPLKTKGGDAGDAVLPAQSAERCDYCGLPADGQPIRLVGDGVRQAQLHRRCETAWANMPVAKAAQ